MMLKRLRSILSFAFTLAIVLVWFLWFRPTSLGGAASYIIVSGISMEPTLYTGDLVILHAQETYGVGDVVAFRIDGGNVIHRIVDKEGDRFILQGDNKKAVDPWTPRQDDILGKLWLHIPEAGELIGMLREPLWLAVFIGLLCFVLLL